jgi:hypothetical protein
MSHLEPEVPLGLRLVGGGSVSLHRQRHGGFVRVQTQEIHNFVEVDVGDVCVVGSGVGDDVPHGDGAVQVGVPALHEHGDVRAEAEGVQLPGVSLVTYMDHTSLSCRQLEFWFSLSVVRLVTRSIRSSILAVINWFFGCNIK